MNLFEKLHEQAGLMMRSYYDFMKLAEEYGYENQDSSLDELEPIDVKMEHVDGESGPMDPAFPPMLSYKSSDLNAEDPMYNSGAPLGIPMAVLIRFNNSDKMNPTMGDEE